MFSVLLATYNRPDLLAQALAALIDRTSEKPDEVVIVNGGDERAAAVVQQYSGRQGVQIKLIRTVNRNLATSRNAGLPACEGDIVAMTDDDAEVFPDWVSCMKQVHSEHPEAGAVGGAVIGATGGVDFLSRLADVVTFPSPDTPRHVRNLPGVNVSYKRSALGRVGLQDESLFRGEDVDFNWRVKKLGFEVYYDPRIKVVHHHRPSVREFLRQHHMYGRAYYLVRKKWPDMYCVYPHKLRCTRDVLKAGYYVAAIAIEPLRAATTLNRWTDRLRAVPLLVCTQLAWRGGMLVQRLRNS